MSVVDLCLLMKRDGIVREQWMVMNSPNSKSSVNPETGVTTHRLSDFCSVRGLDYSTSIQTYYITSSQLDVLNCVPCY